MVSQKRFSEDGFPFCFPFGFPFQFGLPFGVPKAVFLWFVFWSPFQPKQQGVAQERTRPFALLNVVSSIASSALWLLGIGSLDFSFWGSGSSGFSIGPTKFSTFCATKSISPGNPRLFFKRSLHLAWNPRVSLGTPASGGLTGSHQVATVGSPLACPFASGAGLTGEAMGGGSPLCCECNGSFKMTGFLFGFTARSTLGDLSKWRRPFQETTQ